MYLQSSYSNSHNFLSITWYILINFSTLSLCSTLPIIILTLTTMNSTFQILHRALSFVRWRWWEWCPGKVTVANTLNNDHRWFGVHRVGCVPGCIIKVWSWSQYPLGTWEEGEFSASPQSHSVGNQGHAMVIWVLTRTLGYSDAHCSVTTGLFTRKRKNWEKQSRRLWKLARTGSLCGILCKGAESSIFLSPHWTEGNACSLTTLPWRLVLQTSV